MTDRGEDEYQYDQWRSRFVFGLNYESSSWMNDRNWVQWGSLAPGPSTDIRASSDDVYWTRGQHFVENEDNVCDDAMGQQRSVPRVIGPGAQI